MAFFVLRLRNCGCGKHVDVVDCRDHVIATITTETAAAVVSYGHTGLPELRPFDYAVADLLNSDDDLSNQEC